jgi:hypothetical protein
MKKVVFSIRNTRGNQDKKLSGFGYVSEGNLLVPCISKNNKPYIRTFDGVDKACHPVKDRPGEYSGYITMYYEQVPVYREKDGSCDMVDLEVEYKVWFKYVDGKEVK